MPALDRLATSDEARAYAAWARAVGDPVTGGTRPKAFRRGQLTIECASSVWANELTYLGPQILRRMEEVAPGHPVKRFRFVVGRLPARHPAGEGPTSRAPALDGPGPDDRAGGVESEHRRPARRRRQRPEGGRSGDGARAEAKEGVRDERLRDGHRGRFAACFGGASRSPPGGAVEPFRLTKTAGLRRFFKIASGSP